MNLIASVDKNWGIGNEGELLARVPEDMRWFKEHTIGRAVVMGRVTLQTFPQGAALPDRMNIVMSQDPDFMADDCLVVNGIEELRDALSEYHHEDIFVAGGSSVYEMLLPCCHFAYITKFDEEFPADRHLVNLEEEDSWELVEMSEDKLHNGMKFNFCLYKNNRPQSL